MRDVRRLLLCLGTGLRIAWHLWRVGVKPTKLTADRFIRRDGALVFSEITFYDNRGARGPYYNCSTAITAEQLATRSVFSSAPDPVDVAVRRNMDKLLRIYNWSFLRSNE